MNGEFMSSILHIVPLIILYQYGNYRYLSGSRSTKVLNRIQIHNTGSQADYITYVPVPVLEYIYLKLCTMRNKSGTFWRTDKKVNAINDKILAALWIFRNYRY